MLKKKTNTLTDFILFLAAKGQRLMGVRREGGPLLLVITFVFLFCYFFFDMDALYDAMFF